MRALLIVLLTSGIGLSAQVDPGRAIEREYEKLLQLIEAPADGREVPEDEARGRAEQFDRDLKAFLLKWAPRSNEIGRGIFVLGRAHAIAGQPAEAAKAFDRFVKAHADRPEWDEARVAHGSALLDSGQITQARDVLSAYLGDPKTKGGKREHVAQYYLALAQIELGARGAALGLLDQVIASGAETPIPADAALKKIEVLRDANRLDEARAALAQLREENPDSPYLELLREQLAWFGKAAPEFDAIDGWLLGEAQSLAKLKGQVVVLNFFAMRYPACRVELEGLVQLKRDLAGKGVVFLGMTKDYVPYDRQPKEAQRAQLERELKQLGVDFPVAVAKDFRNLRAYGVRGIPHTVVIGKDGTVKHLKVGASQSDKRARRNLEEAVRREL